MRYCARCLYPANHPLGLTFDDEGVCSGCRVHEEKDTLDWAERGERLRRLLGAYRSPSGRTYDCIVPVSGARDSHFIVHLVKHVYGMNPLLVSYNKHWNTPRGIRNLAYLRTLTDSDCLIQTIAPQTVKRVTRAALRQMGSMYWHVLAGETVYPVQVAVRFKIPLIVWGAHQGLEQVGMFSHEHEVEMTRRYREDHDLMGWEAEDLLAADPELTEGDVAAYVYPHDKLLEAVGVRGIYLGNYIRWDSKAQHEAMIARHGYESAPQQRTFDTYNDVDSFHYSGLHDLIKFRKWGYGKATDHACREIRFGRLTREEGIEIVRRHQAVEPRDTGMFLEWLGMDEQELFAHVDRFRDPRIWSPAEDGGWALRDSVERHAQDPGVEKARPVRTTENCDFAVSPSRLPGEAEDGYVLIGRGFADGWEGNPRP